MREIGRNKREREMAEGKRMVFEVFFFNKKFYFSYLNHSFAYVYDAEHIVFHTFA